jgi:hypothetical protein
MRLIDDAALAAVYESRIRPLIFDGVSASPSPRVVIVGGQPGAGKTGAVVTAARDFQGTGFGGALINGDELRPRHPHYKQLVAQDRATAADKTGEDVGLWVERGIRDAAANRFNAVIETTMRQPSVVLRTAHEFRAASYEVELRVVVVDPELSRLGIFERYANAHTTPRALPRFTLPQYHDTALAKMPDTLQAVAGVVSSVRFFDREGVELQAGAGVAPVETLAVLRRRTLAPSELLRIGERWITLRTQLDQEGVPDQVRAGVRAEAERFAKLLAVMPRNRNPDLDR